MNVDRVKILLVDDLKNNLLALEGLLRRDDIEIFMAKSGEEALELMIPHDFALALIDVQMPGMSGFELAEFMRGTKKTKNVPIIFVTATAKEQSFSFKGYESGAVDFLLKPLDTHAVKSKVNIFIELYLQKIELKNQLETITKTQAQLEAAVQIRDEFMAIASHELKTPLSTLLLYSNMRMQKLKKGNLAAFGAEELTKMFGSDEKQLRRIQHLIDDMLDVSRIDSGKLPLRLEKFDLTQLVREIVERNAEQFLMAGCPIHLDLCAEALGSWDRFRIEQVVMNLLTNAKRYGGKSMILVQLKIENQRVRLTVRDRGQGIAPENHGRIFQKFERAESGSQISGLGLGLYIVREILEAHQGTIEVQSQLGEGATFIVDLPLSD